MDFQTLVSVLPNLSIGVVAIGALVLCIKWFVEYLKESRVSHEKSMLEREKALRDVEADVRRNLTEVLTKATMAIEQNSRVMGRVVRILDDEKHHD